MRHHPFPFKNPLPSQVSPSVSQEIGHNPSASNSACDHNSLDKMPNHFRKIKIFAQQCPVCRRQVGSNTFKTFLILRIIHLGPKHYLFPMSYLKLFSWLFGIHSLPKYVVFCHKMRGADIGEGHRCVGKGLWFILGSQTPIEYSSVFQEV